LRKINKDGCKEICGRNTNGIRHKAKGRNVIENNKIYALRESKTPYSTVFGLKKVGDKIIAIIGVLFKKNQDDNLVRPGLGTIYEMKNYALLKFNFKRTLI
jgi:hypothetical protein